MDVRIIRLFRPPVVPMPLYVHTVGYNKQNPMARPEGFSTHQLLFARSGQGYVRLPGQEGFHFGPMEYMLLPAELPHEYYSVSAEPWEVGYISFHGSKVEPLVEHFSLEPCKLRKILDVEAIWNVLDELWELADANKEGAEWEAARIMYGFLLDLNGMQYNEDPMNPEPATYLSEDMAQEVVQHAAHYLNEHYNENISLSNVASSLGYTHQYLNRLFHREYGVSMLQYVQKLRLDRAIGLMSTKDNITVKDIASYVGMETNYFIRMFRKATGMTPDQYRKTNVLS
ncbi:helix-turn-helix transcriptional regulator [Paenibacillus sp. UNC451MF]|uniref:helix-turn-helix transcriptional regulator n=1 Tax=Paenibacillus sp. UNC451MF TaxID=1449063 RepID=UPI00048A91B1|nr:AraC family transcriptional regulator [Paenibacillus sp. UNC451MF]